ncbi:MAG: response regulator [Gemmatimonadota bacterium]
MTYRVLIVDDDPFVRSALERTVRYFGYTVMTAGGGDSAYELLGHDTFDAVLLDIRMPLMTGDTLFLAIVRRWPELRHRIILMSGDPESAAAGWSTELKNCLFLAKPFTMDSLQRALAQVMETANQNHPRRGNGHA